MMRALIVNDTDTEIPEQRLTDWVTAVARELKSRKILPADKENKELSLVFLKEMDAKQLNWNFRQKDYATDVLSFETDDPESLGELIMCPMVLLKQAHEHKVEFVEEVGYMILHGVMHLLGFDHEKNEEEGKKMLALQDQIFEKIWERPKPAKAAKEKPAKAEPKGKAEPKAKADKAAKKTGKAAKPAAPAKSKDKKTAKKTAAKAPAKKAKK